MNNRKLAEKVADMDGYGGGYLYPGDFAQIDYPDPTILRAQLQHRVHFVNEYDKRRNQPMAAWNKAVLHGAPLGTTVTLRRVMPNIQRKEVLVKTGRCAWARVNYETSWQ